MSFANYPIAVMSAVAFFAAASLSPVAIAEGHARYRADPDGHRAKAGTYLRHYDGKPDRPRAAGLGICPPGWRPATPPLNPALGCLPNSEYLAPGREGAIGIPDGRCPDGWEPLTPPRNPMLICKPKGVVAQPGLPRPGRIDPRCPQNWTAVTPPLNRALICLPDQIVATLPGTGAPGLPPGQCPDGWWRVTAPVNPVLGCLPDTIVSP